MEKSEENKRKHKEKRIKMITAKEAKKRMANSIKEWENRYRTTLERIEAGIMDRADEGYNYYTYLCSDNVNLNKLGEVLESNGFSVYKMASSDGLHIFWG